MQQGRRSEDCRQCGNAGSGLENWGQEFGSERKSEKKEVQSEILDSQEDETFQKSYMKVGVKKFLRAGMVPPKRGEFL